MVYQTLCDRCQIRHVCSMCERVGRDELPSMQYCSSYVGEEATDMGPYWTRVCRLAAKQRTKGINKYGVGLELNRKDAVERITYLQEELIDGLMYCEWLKEKLGGEGSDS